MFSHNENATTSMITLPYFVITGPYIKKQLPKTVTLCNLHELKAFSTPSLDSSNIRSNP